MNMKQAISRARGITRELEALGEYIQQISAERRALFAALANRGWTERNIAEAMGISQPAVHEVLKGGGAHGTAQGAREAG